MPMNIKPGYLLKVTTWENDGDNYNTVDIDGLTEEQVRFYIHVCKKFSIDVDASFGNEDVEIETLHNGMIEHIAAYKGVVPTKWKFENDDDVDNYFFCDLLGDIGISSTEYGFWRVFESADVFLVPTAIQNVTSQFK